MQQKIDAFRKLIFLRLGIIYLRYLMGFAFVWASIVKIRGERFTSISVSDPVGYFFEAMYKTDFYWNFLGWAQFIAGVLLMTQHFASFGAFVFLPVILNVCVITWSINFGSGTPVITFMLVGTIGLLAWDYKRWIILFQYDHQIKIDLTTEPKDTVMIDPVWTISGIIFVVLILAIQLIPNGNRFILYWMLTMLLTVVIAFVLVIRKQIKQAG